MYFPVSEYEERWRRVYDAMDLQGFESALVWGRGGYTYERFGDLLYLTNYYSGAAGHEYDTDRSMALGFSAVVLSKNEVPEIAGDMPDYPDGHLAIPANRLHYDGNVIQGAVDVLKARGITKGRVALVGSDFLPMKYARVLEEGLPHVEFVPADKLVRDVRRFKSARELECFREGGAIASAAITEMLKVAYKGGVSQADAAAAAAASVIRSGGLAPILPIASGEGIYHHQGDPLTGFSAGTALRAGDLVRCWVGGPIWQGYWLDPGRTILVGGKGTDRQRELISVTNDITMRLVNEIRPGRKLVDICRLGRELRTAAGAEEDQVAKMWPIFGHGNGLFWEDPWMYSDWADEATVFHEGQTASIEIFVHWPGVGSAGCEQNYIVTKDGTELVTPVDLDW